MKVNILEVATQIKKRAVIQPMSDEDFEIIKENSEFKFDWYNYTKNREHRIDKIFKLSLIENNSILGITSTIDELLMYKAVEIQKIEVGMENRGKYKMYDHIAGCLIAFACKDSINRLSGNVILISKNDLRNHYAQKYGMAITKTFVISDSNNGRRLIKMYLS